MPAPRAPGSVKKGTPVTVREMVLANLQKNSRYYDDLKANRTEYCTSYYHGKKILQECSTMSSSESNEYRQYLRMRNAGELNADNSIYTPKTRYSGVSGVVQETFNVGTGQQLTFRDPSVKKAHLNPVRENILNFRSDFRKGVEAKKELVQKTGGAYRLIIKTNINPEIPQWLEDKIRFTFQQAGYHLHSAFKIEDGYELQYEKVGSVTFSVVVGLVIALLVVLGVVAISWAVVEVSTNNTIQNEQKVKKEAIVSALDYCSLAGLSPDECSAIIEQLNKNIEDSRTDNDGSGASFGLLALGALALGAFILKD